MNVFKKYYSEIYDIIYKNKNYRLEVNYIIKLFKKFNIKKPKILELGCGSGKHLSFFLDKNYLITGVEVNKNMVKHSEKSVKKFIINSDIKNLKLKKKFNVVLSLFNVIGYFHSEHSIRSFFKTASLHLKENGILIFDFWFSPAVRFLRPSRRVKFFNSKNFFIKKKSIPRIISNNIINIKFNFSLKDKTHSYNASKVMRFSENHKIRHFSIEDLCFYANKFNLRYINSYSWLTNKPPSKNSWSAFVIFKKS
jgi:SAM-dependent methyltransferase